MRETLRKQTILYLLLATVFTSTFLSIGAAASGQGVTWELTGGVLTISGTMEDYSNNNKAPWYNRRDEVKKLIVTEGVTTIGENAFWDCGNLAEVQLPQSLKQMGAGAFFGCDSLTEITIPTGVTVLEQGVFGQCEALSSVILHDAIAAIEKDAFSRCYSLKHITLPTGLETIGEHAFFGCVRLQQLTFPAAVSAIGKAAFYGCGNLMTLRFAGQAPIFADQALLGLTVTVFYNKNDQSWSAVTLNNYGGDIRWVAECPHRYTMTFTPPTCEAEGYSTYTCQFCGDRYDDLYIPALGHIPAEAIREGDQLVIYCQTCGEELSREYVQTYLLGDINGDGEVNNKDATRLFQYMTGWNVEVVEAALDVNGDGRVNNKDATRLFQYLSGWDVKIF